MNISPSLDPSNLLLGLAWLGELDRRQIERLWFVDRSQSTVEKTLSRLHDEGLLTRRAWSVRDKQRGVTVPQLARWSLTPKGHAQVRRSAQYPAKPAQVRQQRLIAHDLRTTETIVRLIELGRSSGLSGIYVARELRLNPEEKRPVCDALVVMQFGSFDQPNLVPWSSDPAIEDERRLRFAIEADNNTEPLGVIAGKANAYRRLDEDNVWRAWWTRQYGKLPVPLWVAPTEARAAAIHGQWKRVWFDGHWLIASDAGLQRNKILRRYGGRDQVSELELGPRRPKPQASPASPPQTRQTVVPPVPASPPPAPVALSPARPAQPSGTSNPSKPAVASPTPSRQPSPLQAPAVPVRPVHSTSPIAPRGEAPLLQRRARAIWAALHRVAALLWAAQKLPWRAPGAIFRWYEGLDYGLAANLRLLVFTLALAASGAGLVLHPPGWPAELMPAMPSSTIDAAPDSHSWPTPQATSSAPSCPRVRVTAVHLNLRAEPGRQTKALRQLQAGEALTVLHCQGDQQLTLSDAVRVVEAQNLHRHPTRGRER